MSPARRSIRGWLELVRPPNLFTVPGDPLAGYLLSGGDLAGRGMVPAVLAAIAACLLYMAGLAWNDYADAEEDGKERPDRPIPSGGVTRKQAFWFATLLAALGIALSWLAAPMAGYLALVLTALVLAYTFGTRRYVVAGIVTMGLCRGTSILLGAAATGALPRIGTLPWRAAAGFMCYIGAVSWIAHGETHSQQLGFKRWLPATAATGLFLLIHPSHPLAILCAVATVAWLLYHAWLLRGTARPATVQPLIGSMIRSLLLMQAVLCLAVFPHGLAPALFLLAAWPLASLAGRIFYGS